jgi:2-polyprenyl-6-hydroxyphenyl methylase/3-demethylubiquinone-9 3-methyltransferase
MAQANSIDAREVEQFAKLGAQWWDPKGPMAPLHKLNPVRIGYIRDQAAARFERDIKKLDCLKGLRILDIGCGAGILSEPLAQLGADVVGIDPASENIEIATAHAQESGVDVDYRATTAEDLAANKEQFDVVLAMEVVEHVVDVPAFVKTCTAMVKPGGLMVAATLNRTMKSFALAIVGAEYILRGLPRGTHQWDKFVTPDELEAAIEAGGLDIAGERGVIYNLFADRWQLSSDMDVNYMVAAMRKKASTGKAKPAKKAPTKTKAKAKTAAK